MPVDRPHGELYERSNAHRLEHGDGCTVFPSPRAALWVVIAAALPAWRILEVGCGIGYGAACLADAGAECMIETIENDLLHADLAEREFERLGIRDRVTVLRGNAESILPTLYEQYDMVVEDAGLDYQAWLPVLTRLTRPDGVLITANLGGTVEGWEGVLPDRAITVVRGQPRIEPTET